MTTETEIKPAAPAEALDGGRCAVDDLFDFEDVTTAEQRHEGEERYLRRLSPKCWISTLYRRTGFGWMEWETAIVMLIEPGSRPKRWESDDRDCLIIAGDRRAELAHVPAERLRSWYAENIDGNRNSMETALHGGG